MLFSRMTAMFSAVFLGACQTGGAATPAIIASSDPETLATVKTALAGAMGKARVEISPADLTESTTISVLPPRPTSLEGRSVVKPTPFDIEMRGEDCVAVRRDTGEAYDLPGVDCRPFNE